MEKTKSLKRINLRIKSMEKEVVENRLKNELRMERLILTDKIALELLFIAWKNKFIKENDFLKNHKTKLIRKHYKQSLSRLIDGGYLCRNATSPETNRRYKLTYDGLIFVDNLRLRFDFIDEYLMNDSTNTNPNCLS